MDNRPNKWVCIACENGACYLKSYTHYTPKKCPWGIISPTWYLKDKEISNEE